MNTLKSKLKVTCFIFCMLPMAVLANQIDFSSENIKSISDDPSRLEENEQTLNLAKGSSFVEGCSGNSLFGQKYMPPFPLDWKASTSDKGAAGSILVFDNFTNTGSINRVSFWGINGYNNNERWYVCYESPMDFQITFFVDNDGMPGAEVASYDVSCVGNQTGLLYWGVFELYQYFADLPEPVELSEGWIAIQGMNDIKGPCWFEWMSSAEGYDGNSMQWDGSSLYNTGLDRAFCLEHQEFLCGDIDGDNAITFFDVIYFIYFKYKGGPPPISALMADVNHDGSNNILDAIYLLNFLYKNGASPLCP